MRKIILSLFLGFSLTIHAQVVSRIETSATVLNFDTAYTDSLKSLELIIRTEPEGLPMFGLDTIRFRILGNGFDISDSLRLWKYQKDTIRLYFKPKHNIGYQAHLLISGGCFGALSITLKGVGKYREPYYNATQGLSGNALKTTLKSIISANYISLGYNLARDSMFMSIDNKKMNGQWASLNTLECVYTGRLAEGYASRADAQTNDNFNTEHTWPQSQFGQAEPMRSDLHHLFPTDNPANGIRADYPFGMVSFPSWSQGGSKGISDLFEPRNVQKGKTARAMLYFALRYQNYDSFLNDQETILRTWSDQFPPDSIEKRRNEAIFRNQRNRNPFVDHPEFLERIKFVHKADPADPLKNSLLVMPDALVAGPNGTFILIGWKYRVYSTVINSGNVTARIDSVSMFVNGQTFRSHLGYPADIEISDSVIDPSESSTINFDLYPLFHNSVDTIYIYGSSFLKKISLDLRFWTESINDPELNKLTLYPNPTNNSFVVKSPSGEQFETVELFNSVGQKLLCTDLISSPDEINIAYLPAGLYFVKLKTATGKIYSDKLIKY